MTATKNPPIAFVTTALPTVMDYTGPQRVVGRLFTPRMLGAIDRTIDYGVPFAADNDAFNDSFSVSAWRRMVDYLCGTDPIFVTVPDVVGDADATRARFREHVSYVADAGLRAAYVAQDGETPEQVPWDEIAAVFIGGSTEWKMSEQAADIIRAAQDRGIWVHVGRVNTRKRYAHFAALGVDSIDGSSLGRFPKRQMPEYLRWRAETAAA